MTIRGVPGLHALEPSEAAFQQAVVEYAQANRWMVCHFHDSRRQVAPGKHVGDRLAAGFPDLVMVRDGYLVFAELKRRGGRPTGLQRSWLDALARVSGNVVVRCWTNEDWSDIEYTLGRR